MIKKNLFLKMNIQELFKKYPFIVKVFDKYGLKCNSCMFSKNVSFEEALQSSGISSKAVIEEIIKYLEREE